MSKEPICSNCITPFKTTEQKFCSVCGTRRKDTNEVYAMAKHLQTPAKLLDSKMNALRVLLIIIAGIWSYNFANNIANGNWNNWITLFTEIRPSSLATLTYFIMAATIMTAVILTFNKPVFGFSLIILFICLSLDYMAYNPSGRFRWQADMYAYIIYGIILLTISIIGVRRAIEHQLKSR